MNEHKAAVMRAVTILGEAFRQKVSETTIRAYELGLADLGPEAIECGVGLAIRESQFMPTVFELRKLCGVLPKECRSLLAWAAVKKAVHEIGEYRSVDFDDPVINATIRVMGGWDQLCDTEVGEKFDAWKRKQFEETYRSLMASGVGDDLARPLIGICDNDNSARGYSKHVMEPVRVVTGLPVERKRINRASPRLLAISAGIGDGGLSKEFQTA